MSKQTEQEREALITGASRRTKRNAKRVAKEQETTTATGSIALSRAIVPLSLGIIDWQGRYSMALVVSVSARHSQVL